METIEVQTYQFAELTKAAKEIAIRNWQSKGVDVSYIYDEAHKTVQKFNDIFDLKEGNHSWLEYKMPGMYLPEKLVGWRLRTWIINNCYDQLIKGKYFSLWSKTEKSFKYHREGYPVLKQRYSKVMFERSYPLTGICYDADILQPLYEFLDWNLRPDYNSYMTIEALLNDCFESLQKSIEKEIEDRNSEEACIEDFEANETKFLQNGKIFNY